MCTVWTINSTTCTVALKKMFPKLIHLSPFERHSKDIHLSHRSPFSLQFTSFTSFTSFMSLILHIIHVVHVYPVIRMLFTNDCRSCFPVQNMYKCTCSLHIYLHVYVHGCVISLYLLYSTLLYCVHLNDSAVKDEHHSHCSPFVEK